MTKVFLRFLPHDNRLHPVHSYSILTQEVMLGRHVRAARDLRAERRARCAPRPVRQGATWVRLRLRDSRVPRSSSHYPLILSRFWKGLEYIVAHTWLMGMHFQSHAKLVKRCLIIAEKQTHIMSAC